MGSFPRHGIAVFQVPWRASARILSISSRYFSKALRPLPVSRYSVLGSLLANDLEHSMYPATSSLRACTLRLPSVVARRLFKSAKLTCPLAASALRIPSLIRAWTSGSGRKLKAEAALARDRAALSAIFSGNEETKDDMKSSKPRPQHPMVVGCKQRHCPQHHKKDA